MKALGIVLMLAGGGLIGSIPDIRRRRQILFLKQLANLFTRLKEEVSRCHISYPQLFSQLTDQAGMPAFLREINEQQGTGIAFRSAFLSCLMAAEEEADLAEKLSPVLQLSAAIGTSAAEEECKLLEQLFFETQEILEELQSSDRKDQGLTLKLCLLGCALLAIVLL